MKTRGIVAAVLLASPFVLAACSSSAGDSTAAGPVDQVSFQVRPVLTEKQASAADCASSAAAAPTATEKVERICSADRTVVYSLGPAAFTEAEVKTVATGERFDDERVANVELDAKGTAAFAKVTETANRNERPTSQFAIVVDGAVASAPAVTQGAITGGQLEVSFGDAKQLDAFMAGWPASKIVTRSSDDEDAALVTPASKRCEALVRAEPEFAVLEGAVGLVSRAFPISASSGTVAADVIRRTFPDAGPDAEFVQCSAPMGPGTASPRTTCPEGELVLAPGKTWLIDAAGHEELVSAKDTRALLVGDDGSPCS